MSDQDQTLAPTKEQWAKLAEPFPDDWVERLPKPLKGRDDDRGPCRQGTRYSADGHYCGGFHARAVHLDYIGHAGITMRLNNVLGPTGWEFTPYAEDSDGMPIMSRDVFFAKLTIGGVTKWDVATNFNGLQEALGDALRRCAMRFGVGTYLWSKSEHSFQMAKAEEPEPASPPVGRGDPPPSQQQERPAHITAIFSLLANMPDEDKAELAPWWDQQVQAGHLPTRENKATLTEPQATWIMETAAGIEQRREDARQRQEAVQDPH